MGTLLDTSFLIEVERDRATIPQAEDVSIAAVTASELLHGVHRSDRAHRGTRLAFVEWVLATVPTRPFTLEVARVHSRLWAERQAAGRQLGAHDLIVAATALALDLGLATRDRKAFDGIPGLRIVSTGTP